MPNKDMDYEPNPEIFQELILKYLTEYRVKPEYIEKQYGVPVGTQEKWLNGELDFQEEEPFGYEGTADYEYVLGLFNKNRRLSEENYQLNNEIPLIIAHTKAEADSKDNKFEYITGLSLLLFGFLTSDSLNLNTEWIINLNENFQGISQGAMGLGGVIVLYRFYKDLLARSRMRKYETIISPKGLTHLNLITKAAKKKASHYLRNR